MFPKPPLVASVTAAVTNVAANTTLIAAPAPGECIRVIKIMCSLAQNVGAGAFELNFRDGAGGTQIAGVALQSPGERYHEIDFAEPGLLLPGLAANALVISAIASIAGPSNIRVHAHYYIDIVQ